MATYNILTVGTSLTAGDETNPTVGNRHWSYRGALYSLLRNAGHTVTVSGPVNIPTNGSDGATAGYGGATIGPDDHGNTLSARANTIASAGASANLVILEAGANDVFGGNSVFLGADAASKLSIFVGTMRGLLPNAQFVLHVTPNATWGSSQQLTWSAALWTTIQGIAAANQSTVRAVDNRTLLLSGDYTDGLHWTQNGGAPKVAASLFSAIQSFDTTTTVPVTGGRWKLSGPVKETVATLAKNAPPAQVETQVMAAIRDAFGANPVVRMLRDGNVARAATLSGSMTADATSVSLPQSIASQVTAATSATGGTKLVEISGDNGNKLIGTWGVATDSPGLIVPGDLVANQQYTHGPIVLGSSLVNSTVSTGQQQAFLDAAVLWRDNASPTAEITQDGLTLNNTYGRSRFPTYASLSAQMAIAVTPPAHGQRLTGDGSGLENCDAQSVGEGKNLFPGNVDSIRAWHWFYAASGHSAANTALAVADCALVALRPDGVWQTLYSGGIGSGWVWNGNSSNNSGGGQDIGGRNPNWTVIKPSGRIGYELWAQSSGKSGVSLVNGTLLRSALCVVVMCRVKPIVDNPALPDDRANARYIGQLGFDWYNTGLQNAGRKRYDYWGYPLHAADADTTAKRLITNTGDWQWIVLATYDPGVGNDFYVRNKPWVTGYQDYNQWTRAAGGYAITKAQFLNNPPPVPGNLEA